MKTIMRIVIAPDSFKNNWNGQSGGFFWSGNRDGSLLESEVNNKKNFNLGPLREEKNGSCRIDE